jgi:hypothetical protein
LGTEETMTLYRRLARENSLAYLPDLARSLWGYAMVCDNYGVNLPEALTATEEAIDIFQSLAEGLPEVYGDELREVHETRADVLDALRRAGEARRTPPLVRRRTQRRRGSSPPA